MFNFRAVLALVLLALPSVAGAGPLYDFGAIYAPGGVVVSLGPGVFSVGPVSAQGYSTRSGSWAPDRLIARNESKDHGLGVCSESQALVNGPCKIGATDGGDYNELSNQGYYEAILFSLAVGHRWTELWVSSLDGGDGDGVEEGRVHWGNSGTVASLLGDPSFPFQWGNFGSSVEGNILPLAPASFDEHAPYLLFVPDGFLNDNNDYLVWGATTTAPVPEPGTLALLGGGLAALRLARRRRSS